MKLPKNPFEDVHGQMTSRQQTIEVNSVFDGEECHTTVTTCCVISAESFIEKIKAFLKLRGYVTVLDVHRLACGPMKKDHKQLMPSHRYAWITFDHIKYSEGPPGYRLDLGVARPIQKLREATNNETVK